MTAYAINAPYAMTTPYKNTAPRGSMELRSTTAPRSGAVSVRRVVNVRPVPTAAGRARRIAVVLVLMALVALLAPRAFAGSEATDVMAFDTYTVAQGETLWSIATAITGPGEDVRDTVSQLQTLNTMGDSSLQAGEQIYIPALDR